MKTTCVKGRMKLVRGTALVLGLALILATFPSGMSSAAAKNQGKPFAGMTVTFGAGQANIIATLQKSGFDAKFKAATGASISWVPSSPDNNLAQLIQSKGASPPYDVVDMDNTAQPVAVQAGVVQKIKKADLTASGKYIPESEYSDPGYGPPWIISYLGNCVNLNQYKANHLAVPTSVAGWFAPGLSGHISLPAPSSFAWADLLVPLALNYGVPLNKPDQLISRLRKINVYSLETSSSQAQSDLSSGATWLQVVLNNARCSSKVLGTPVTLAPFNFKVNGKTYGYVGSNDTLDVAKGISPQMTKLSIKFIDMLEGPDGMGPLLNTYGYLPSRTDLVAAAKKNPTLAPVIGAYNPNQVYLPTPKAFDTFHNNITQWTSSWNQVFAKS